MPALIPEPWLSFLREVDGRLEEPVRISCLGGFVLMVLWGLPRPTGDVDFIDIGPSTESEQLLRIAGEGSDLAKQYKLTFHRVTIADCPADYASRLIEIAHPALHRLNLLAFEVHDLALAKLGRNSRRDREDVAFLARNGALDAVILKERFETELRPYALNEQRSADALQLWLDDIFGGSGQ